MPDSNVGAIMGKKGETLAELRKSSGATIRVHDSHETPSCGRGTDRVVTVRRPGCEAHHSERTTVAVSMSPSHSVVTSGNSTPVDCTQAMHSPALHLLSQVTMELICCVESWKVTCEMCTLASAEHMTIGDGTELR